MRKICLPFRLLLPFLLLSFAVAAKASESDLPIMTVTTDAVELQFEMVANEATSVEVDFGNNNVQQFDVSADYSNPTVMRGKVGKDRTVRIYGDGNLIYYFNSEGYYITSFDASNTPGLEILRLPHNALTTLDVSKNLKLYYLNVQGNTGSDGTYPGLSTISLGELPELEVLNVSTNTKLATIDLTKHPKLKEFLAWGCSSIQRVDPSNCPLLERLSIDGTGIYSIDVTKNPELKILNLSTTRVGRVDVTKNPKLEELYVSRNDAISNGYQLGTIDVSQNPALRYLFCQNNNLSTIDLSHNPELTSLYASNNNLSEIDLSNNPKMIELLIRQNRFNFNTLPRPSAQLTYYEYTDQQPMEMPSEIASGSALDLTKEVWDGESLIKIDVFKVSEDVPNTPIALELGKDYSVEDAKITFLKPQTDSVYCQVLHELFENLYLNTKKFMVKDPSEIGKPSKVLSFTTSKQVGEQVSLSVATNVVCDEMQIDFGDGNLQTYSTTTYINPYGGTIYGNVAGDAVSIYLPSGVALTQLEAAGNGIMSIDVTKSKGLTSIDLSNNELSSIDLKYNKNLITLTLPYNKLTSLDLSGASSSLSKTLLGNVNVSGNELTSIILDGCIGLKWFSASNNKLKTVDLSMAEDLENIEMNSNSLESLDLSNNTNLQYLYLRENQLKELDLSANTRLGNVWIPGNRFKFSTLPTTSSSMFFYAPQKAVEIKDKGKTVDLSSEYMVNGKETVYVWKDSKNRELIEGEDYTINKGVTTFLSTELGAVHCEMTNEAFPMFSGSSVLKTTETTPTGDPTEVVASFVVNGKAGAALELRMGSVEPDTYVYVDFGDGELVECHLNTTYSVHTGTLKADNGEVKVLAYEKENNGIKIFSAPNVTLKSVDVTALTDLESLNLTNAGLRELDITKNTKLQELNISGNRFKEFSVRHLPDLYMFSCQENDLTSVDVTANPKLEYFYCGGNNLESIDLSKSSILKYISADRNKISQIDFSGNPLLHTASLSENLLKSVDLENNAEVRVVNLSRNYFTFASLPALRENWTVYTYAPQQDIDVAIVDGVADLSTQKSVGNVATAYSWSLADGTPLVEGTDYVVNDGKTSFLTVPEAKVVCTMTNSAFPGLELKTIEVAVDKKSGVADATTGAVRVYAANSEVHVIAEPGSEVTVYSASGLVVRHELMISNSIAFEGLPSGIYIVTIKSEGKSIASKVAL